VVYSCNIFASSHGEPILSGRSKRQKTAKNTRGGAASLPETRPEGDAVETVVLTEENRPATRRARNGRPLTEEQLERRVHDAGAQGIASGTGRSKWRTERLDRERSEKRIPVGESEWERGTEAVEEWGKGRMGEMRASAAKLNDSRERRNCCRAEKGSITRISDHERAPKPSARAASPHAQGGSVPGIKGFPVRVDEEEEEIVRVGDGRMGKKGQVGGPENGRKERNVGKEQFQQMGPAKESASGQAVLLCDECDNAENQELMLRCAARGCSTIVHVYCLDGEMEAMPTGEWFCTKCEIGREEQNGREGRHSASRSRRGSERGPSVTKPEVSTEPGQQGGSGHRSRYVLGGPPVCQQPGCTARAWYGEHQRGTAVPEVCYMHKSPGMVRKRAPICEVRGCTKVASYDFPGEKGRRRCNAHKEDGMFNLPRLCEFKGCLLVASFGSSLGRKSTRCSLHRCDGMVTIKTLCREHGCSARARYGYSGLGAQFCRQHSQEGMIHDPHGKSGLQRRM
jgi:hypothetical protein